MKRFKIIFSVVAFVLCAANAAFALDYCSRYQIRNAAIGFTCITAKGYQFTKVDWRGESHAWMGPDSVTWSDYRFSYANKGPDNGEIVLDSEAVRECQSIGGSVPSVEDYKRAERYGFREVIDRASGTFLTRNIDAQGWGYQAHCGSNYPCRISRGSRSIGSSLMCVSY